MPDSTVADSLAAADRRIASTRLLCEIFIGHIDHQHQELQRIRAAIASTGKPEEQRHAVPSDISPGMLAG
jgi:hypothetical protein